MPIRKQDYHPDWPRISQEVRDAAGQRCEWCGAPNRRIIERRPRMRFYPPDMDQYYVDWISIGYITNYYGDEEDPTNFSWKRLKYYGLTRIILTTAHLDRDSHNNDRHNLAALCQRCHLRHDIRQHLQNRRYGRYHDREQQLKLKL